MTANEELKGVKGGNCNVTASQRPEAVYYNKSTKAYYCKSCADEINWPGGRADTMRLYGTPLLCELDDANVFELRLMEFGPCIYYVKTDKPRHDWQRRKKGRS